MGKSRLVMGEMIMSERELERILQTEADEETVDKAVRDFLQSPQEVAPMGRYKAQEKYDAANTRVVKMKLNKNTDADILAKLESCGNMQGYIKALIRADLRKEQE